VQSLLQRMYDAGDVYRSHYEGPYCVACEGYYVEEELIDGKCPVHHRPVEIHAEDNWFFRLSKYGEPLLAHIRRTPSSSIRDPAQRGDRLHSGWPRRHLDVTLHAWGIPPWDGPRWRTCG
jgi:methionyl-tRNA synthetase